MVYLPTFGWFFMVSVGKYIIHGSYGYGTSYETAVDSKMAKINLLPQSLPSLLCRSTAGMRNNIRNKNPVNKKHSGMDLYGSSQPSGIQHQRRTNDKWLTNQFFRSHKETHPQLPPALGTKNQSRLATNTNIIDGPSWLLTWYLQHFENSRRPVPRQCPSSCRVET